MPNIHRGDDQMKLTDEQYRALADDLVENLYMEGEIENYVIFLWQELEKLDPTWTETLSIDSIDLEARLAEEEAFKQEALVSKPEQDGWETVIPEL
jgi:hypothetical protein